MQENETLILIGETGSGKSTQIPQFLLDGGLLTKGMVAVSQPRRVAAITLSKRVAQERSRQLGDLVGYIELLYILTISLTPTYILAMPSALKAVFHLKQKSSS